MSITIRGHPIPLIMEATKCEKQKTNETKVMEEQQRSESELIFIDDHKADAAAIGLYIEQFLKARIVQTSIIKTNTG